MGILISFVALQEQKVGVTIFKLKVAGDFKEQGKTKSVVYQVVLRQNAIHQEKSKTRKETVEKISTFYTLYPQIIGQA